MPPVQRALSKLPSRKELADKLEVLEARLMDFTLGAGTGAVLARSPTARSYAAGGVRAVSPYALIGDAAIRQEESILYRIGDRSYTTGEILAAGFEAKERQLGVSPSRPLAAGSPVPVTKKTPNKFSKAVSKSMKALKSSKFYGKKGILSNAKAAFKVSTKAASRRSRGLKSPKSGAAKIAYKAAKGVYTDEILRRKMKQ